MNQEEFWKPIKGFEGFYEVSNLGRIKSLERITNHPKGKRLVREYILKPYISRRGYYEVTLCRLAYRVKCEVHKIVLETFVPNVQNKPCIDHINTNKLDNRLSNLHWVTHKENSNNPITLAKIKRARSDKNYISKMLESRRANGKKYAPIYVYQYDKNGTFISRYDSLSDAYRKTGTTIKSITLALDNFHLTGGGYLWSTTYHKQVTYTPNPIHNAIAICAYDGMGNKIGEWKSKSDAIKSQHIHRRTLEKCLAMGCAYKDVVYKYDKIKASYPNE